MPVKRPFFIVGSPRSGTTLLQAMLNAGETMFIPPETHFLPTYSVWTTGGWRRPDREQVLRLIKKTVCERNELPVIWPELRRELETTGKDAVNQFDTLLSHIQNRRAPDRRIGEKTPAHLLYVERLAEHYRDAQFIRIVRDGRDVVVSHREAFGSHPLHMAVRWRVHQRQSQRFSVALSENRFLTVRYENLVTEPEEELRRVCAYLDEPFDPAMLRPQDRDELGFAKRESHKVRTLMPIDTTRIGRYRDILAPRTIAMLQVVFGKTLVEEGYELDPVSNIVGYVTAALEFPKMVVKLRRSRAQQRRNIHDL
jgi:hypothetical protein